MSGLDPQTGIGQLPQQNPGPSQNMGRGNLGMALGNFANDEKQANLNQTTQAFNLAKVARDRVTQIWQAGAQNPAIQQSPQVHKQLALLYKQMGVTPPVNDKNELDWDSMAPAKSLNDLTPQMLTQLREATPDARRGLAHSMHLIDADKEFLDAPAQATPAQLNTFQKDYDAMIKGNTKSTMTASQFKNWVETNRRMFDQAIGPGAADTVLSDPKVFEDMSAVANTNLQTIQADLDNIKARTKDKLGLTPTAQARITSDLAKAQQATDMGKLDEIRTQYVGAQLRDLPGLDAAKIRDYNSKTDGRKATIAHLNELVETSRTSGTGSPLGQVSGQLKVAENDLASNERAYVAAVNGGLGVPDEVAKAYHDAQTNVDTLRATQQELNSPGYRAAYNAAKAGNTSGVTATPVTNTAPPDMKPGTEGYYRSLNTQQKAAFLAQPGMPQNVVQYLRSVK